MTFRTIIAAACAGAFALGSAQAAENGLINYPVGAAGTNNAGFPPVPGVFVLEQLSYSHADGLYGNDGKKLPIPFKSDAYVGTTRVLLSYPFELPGHGRLYSQIVLPAVGLNTSFFGHKASTFGLANITVSPFITKWRLTDNLFVAGGIDVALNTGPYDARKFSVATGHSSVIPVLSLRYDNPVGLDIGVSQRLLLNQRNATTKYQSGTVYALDFQAGWNLTRDLKIGAVGGYFKQIANDTGPFGVPPGGNRSEYLTVGPSITYETAMLGRPVNFNLNYQVGVLARNTTKGSTAWLNVAIPLYVMGPPPKPVE